MNEHTIANFFGLGSSLPSGFEKVLFITTIALVIHLIARFVLHQAKQISGKTSGLWDDAVVDAIKSPAVILIWLLSIIAILLHLNKHYDYHFIEELNIIRKLSIVGCLAWFSTSLIYNFSRNFITLKNQNKIEVDQTTIDALSKLARLIVIVLAALIAVQTLGFSISALLTAGGIGGIAIGFAAKDLLANFFGGLTIYLDRPFNVGDWVRSPDKDIEGTVEYISWRHTRIRAFNKNPIYVPNALFTHIVVENPSRMSNRRIKTTIGIRYDDINVMQPIVEDIKKMLQNHDEIDTNQTLIVNFNTFNASSIDIMIYTFTKTVEWVKFHAVKEDVYLKIADIVAGHKAQIAFPTQTLHIDNAGGDASA